MTGIRQASPFGTSAVGADAYCHQCRSRVFDVYAATSLSMLMPVVFL
jgi:hypothetical protein